MQALEQKRNKSKIIVCIGDSLISSEPAQWTRELETRLGGSSKYKVINKTVFSAEGAQAAIKSLKKGETVGVIVALGTTDAQSWDPAEFCSAYRELLEEIRSELDPIILAMILPIPQLRPSEHRCDTSILNEQVPSSLRDLALNTGVALINVRSALTISDDDGIVNPAYYDEDGISPNRKGRAAIAQAIVDVIFPALTQATTLAKSNKKGFIPNLFRRKSTDNQYSWTKRFLSSSSNRYSSANNQTASKLNHSTTLNILAGPQVNPMSNPHNVQQQVQGHFNHTRPPLDPETPKSICSDAASDRSTILLSLPPPVTRFEEQRRQKEKIPPLWRQYSSQDEPLERPTSVSDCPTFRETNRLSVIDLSTRISEPKIELQVHPEPSNAKKFWFPSTKLPQTKPIDNYYECAAAVPDDEPLTPKLAAATISSINDIEDDHDAPRPSSNVQNSILMVH